MSGTGGLPWSWERKLRDFLKPGVRVLDLSGDGGAYLLGLGHPAELVSTTDDGAGFDLVVAYQVDFAPEAAARALNRGGFLVTQQIGGHNRPGQPDFNLENQAPRLQAAGFRLMYSHQAYVPGEDDHRLQHRFIMIGKKK